MVSKRNEAGDVPDGALPKEQRWVVRFLNDTVRSEFKALNADLRAAFWKLHEDIRFFGFERITKKQARRLAGTKDLWELRFKAESGIARGLYVQKTGRTIVVLVFFAKKSEGLPQRILDLALERRHTAEEAIVDAPKDERMAAKLIDAREVFDEEYPVGSTKRAEFYKDYMEHVRRRQRTERIEALLARVKAKLASVLLALLRRTAAD